MSRPSNYYILEKDVLKVDSSTSRCLRGDVMVKSPDHEYLTPVGKVRLATPEWVPGDARAEVICAYEDATILGREDAFTLLAIPDATSRWAYYSKPDALMHARQLRNGIAVEFRYGAEVFDAVIIFRGEISGLGRGIRFGLEILSANNTVLNGTGVRSDGCFAGKKVFECSQGRGAVTTAQFLMLTSSPEKQKTADAAMQGLRAPKGTKSTTSYPTRTRREQESSVDGPRNAPLSSSWAASGKTRSGSGVQVGLRVWVVDKVDGFRQYGEVKELSQRQSGSHGSLREMAHLQMESDVFNGDEWKFEDGRVVIPVELLSYETGLVPPQPHLSDSLQGVAGRGGSPRSSVSSHAESQSGPSSSIPLHLLSSVHQSQEQLYPKRDDTKADVFRRQEILMAQFKKTGGASDVPSGSATTRSSSQTSSSTSGGSQQNGTSAPPARMAARDWLSLSVGSMVEVPGTDGWRLSGVVKWLSGPLDASNPPVAGIELEGAISNGTDGHWHGIRRFNCEPNRAYFTKLNNCTPDSRFQTVEPASTARSSSLTASGSGNHGVDAARTSGRDTQTYQKLEMLKKSESAVGMETVLQVVGRMQESGNAGKWRHFVGKLGYNSSQISVLMTSNLTTEDDRFLSVMADWAEHKNATIGQLTDALCDTGCERIAVDLLTPLLQKSLATTKPSSEHAPHGQSKLSARLNPPAAIKDSQPVYGAFPPAKEVIKGRPGGIQGHNNSCYMDATLFAMFAHSMAFDSVLHRQIYDNADAEQVRKHILENIVNPLRVKGYVSSKHIMTLRREFGKLGKVEGLTHAEKDPEEFLNLMWQTTLSAEPFLQLKAPQRNDSTYIYQIFVEANGGKRMATVQELVEQSFAGSDLTLSEVPSVLVLQLPRFGRGFKQFDRIIPSMSLNITNLLAEGSRQCGICGQPASLTCHDCRKSFQREQQGTENAPHRGGNLLRSDETYVNYCAACSKQAHSHRKRQGHKPRNVECIDRQLRHDLVSDKLETLELFAVICIETSHYVSFVKCNGQDDGDDFIGGADDVTSESQWCFFDSMADRIGEQDGYNIPEVKLLPDLLDWVNNPEKVQSTSDREMPPEIRRLLCDPYMCLYQNKSMLMYN